MSYELFAAIKTYYDAAPEPYLSGVPLFRDRAAQDTPFPYITMSLISDVPETGWPMSWTQPRCRTYRVQFSVFAENQDGVGAGGYGDHVYGYGTWGEPMSAPEHAARIMSDLRDRFYQKTFAINRYTLQYMVDEGGPQFDVDGIAESITDFMVYLERT